MPWNYRIMRRNYDDIGEILYKIHEVYYDKKGNVIMWTEDSTSPSGDTPEELKEDFEYFKKALSKPILDCETGKEIKEKK